MAENISKEDANASSDFKRCSYR